MPTLDQSLSDVIAEELDRHGVTVHAGVAVARIERGPSDRLIVHGTGGTHCCADLVLVAAGVQPDRRLAVQGGVETGAKGAIRVDRRMRTNLEDVYAAGDCVETWHRLRQSATSRSNGRACASTRRGAPASIH
ncbi:MAG: FAD-dependent oxidoreductase [Chloroflexi bacterium]|nr:FAD-dependent oxidoreductase [Chloroflexota bacterium]